MQIGTLGQQITTLQAFQHPVRTTWQLPAVSLGQNEFMLVTRKDPLIIQVRMPVCTSVVAMHSHEFAVIHLTPSGYAQRDIPTLTGRNTTYIDFVTAAIKSGVMAMEPEAMELYLEHMLSFVNVNAEATYVVGPVWEFDMGSMLGAKKIVEHLFQSGIQAQWIESSDLQVLPKTFQPSHAGRLI